MKKILFTLISLFFISAFSASAAQVQNVSFEDQGEEIVITYDLLGEADQNYEVSLSLMHGETLKFPVNRRNLSGDVGRNVQAGEKKKIIWQMLKDYPDGLVGDEFRFVVSARVQTKRSGNQYGIHLGWNSSTMNGGDDYKSKSGIIAGGFMTRPLGENGLNLQIEINYTMKGCNVDDYDWYWDEGQYKLNLNYIEIPVLVQINTNGSFYFCGGPSLAFIVSAKYKEEDYSTSYNIMSEMKGVELSIVLGGGIKLTPQWMLSARYSSGLTYAYEGYKNRVFSAMMNFMLN